MPTLRPVAVSVCGDPVALSVTLMVAVCVLPALGWKVTETRQLEPPASAAVQPLLAMANSALDDATLVMVSELATGPVLVTLKVSGVLLVLRPCEPKLRLEG